MRLPGVVARETSLRAAGESRRRRSADIGVVPSFCLRAAGLGGGGGSVYNYVCGCVCVCVCVFMQMSLYTFVQWTVSHT